jgi:hypothetical protein
MTRNSSRVQAKLPCSISLYPKGFLLVKESLVTLVNLKAKTIRILSLVVYLSYTRDVMHMHEGLNPRSRYEPQEFHQEPKSIGSVTHLTECLSIPSLVTYSLSFLLSDTAECPPLAAKCLLHYRGAQLGNPRALIPYRSAFVTHDGASGEL